MILDRLEITNFKSYKGTHLLGPLDRFSCIIGPNGSGKSNILDAISFVLNVPNSYLRVKHLKNLVEYNSTEASVKIYINSMIFERRIYKDGANSNANDSAILDSANLNQDIYHSTNCKYFVNGNKVTQRQYNQELEQLNILSKVKNFVIYQGDVIKSDVDLLKMIENVCGSDAYAEEYNVLSEKISVMNKSLSLKYEKRKDCLEMMKEIKEVKDKEKTFESLINQKDLVQRKIYEAEIKSKKIEVDRIKETIKSLEQMKENEKYNEIFSTVNKTRSETAKLQKEYFEKETELTFERSRQTKKRVFDIEAKTAELKELVDNLTSTKEELAKIPSSIEFSENVVFEGEILTHSRFEDVLKEKEIEYSQKVSGLEKQLSEMTLLNFDKLNKRDQLQNTIKQINSKISKIKARNSEIEKGK
ncbi:uncharacterized protein VICG_00393 [Vittaforma corneae ATCC 50505]|uniref:RecF/RecN/SMC N-terminal domain-containing protein n=1 Tax=Vittaforma corneae (strain ATCC 50505) TaxID=993615 RepID=L2GP94_VITCO|nr:uncharacterized protein VICG_00393 [Vittaforma corneae ATCC 50505]ELA42641.1 hypothetical protein VICG_00393 [Vittaforma corneae ATCC 50505]